MLTVNGTTGESMSLSVAERKILAEEWCQKAKGRQVITQPLGLNLDADVEFYADEEKKEFAVSNISSVFACVCRMDQVIVHVGCMSLKDSQELVSCYIYE